MTSKTAKRSKIECVTADGRTQPVAVDGRNQAVGTSTGKLDAHDAPTLHELLSRSPVNRIRFWRESIRGPVREVDLREASNR